MEFKCFEKGDEIEFVFDSKKGLFTIEVKNGIKKSGSTKIDELIVFRDIDLRDES